MTCEAGGGGKKNRGAYYLHKPSWWKENLVRIQLFREMSSDKVHATNPKGIVGCLEFTVFQRNLKEWQERPWTYVCEC